MTAEYCDDVKMVELLQDLGARSVILAINVSNGSSDTDDDSDRSIKWCKDG